MCVIAFVRDARRGRERERKRERERERERERKLSCTVQRTATSAVNDAASNRRQTNRQDPTLVA